MAVVKLFGDIEKEAGIYYEVDFGREPIGIGGMGKVYEGKLVNESTGSTRAVAIKFMYDDLLPQAIEKARREASICLHNDNLLEMLGFLETEDEDSLGILRKHYHVISELLDGITLQEVIEGSVPSQEEDGGFGMGLYNEYRDQRTEFTLRVIKAVLSGVMAMHDAGYIHRDIDPSNIMLTTDGRVKLIDFGIAKKMTTLTANDRSFTVDGKFIGKAKYAAPEQVLGDIAHQNQSTDIYAVGILMFQLLCGHLPFIGPDHEVMQMQIKEKVPVSEIKNLSLRSIVKRATEKNQAKRFQSASEFRASLDNPRPPFPIEVISYVVISIAGLIIGILIQILS